MSGRTNEVAAAARLLLEYLEELLLDEQARWNVVRVGGRWSLTSSAEARHGRYLRRIVRPLEAA